MSLGKILHELRSWRETPSHRERIRSRPLDKETPDPVPMAVPVGYDAPPTMEELIQRYVRQEVSQAASADGHGTFEDEDDFAMDDDEGLPFSQFENDELPMEMLADPDMPAAAPVEDPEVVTAPAAEPPPSEATEQTDSEK